MAKPKRVTSGVVVIMFKDLKFPKEKLREWIGLLYKSCGVKNGSEKDFLEYTFSVPKHTKAKPRKHKPTIVK